MREVISLMAEDEVGCEGYEDWSQGLGQPGKPGNFKEGAKQASRSKQWPFYSSISDL
ncbi:MAG TPA: hypothetical protein VFM05_04115 [Candidatus Saccharimonadales bacterium]|nr:hypothetical protein [Candidatus Saccharimonadales bacterium]